MIDGVSMVHGPKGCMCIFHVMQFKWDKAGELKHGIGRTDAELIKAWPGLLYDNSRDYIMWGFAAADHWLPEDVTSMKGAEIQQLVLDLTGDWHPNLPQDLRAWRPRQQLLAQNPHLRADPAVADHQRHHAR
jgi:hypothetical protein